MSRTYDRDLLSHKIRWEGGVLATLDYGLPPEEIADPALRSTWAELAKLHAQMKPLIKDLERALRGAS